MTRKDILLRTSQELAERVLAWADDQPTRPSLNTAIVVLLEQALDAQRQGVLDQILAEVQLLREDLGRTRRLRKAAAIRRAAAADDQARVVEVGE